MKREQRSEYVAPELEIALFEEREIMTMSDTTSSSSTSSFDPNDDSGWSSGWI